MSTFIEQLKERAKKDIKTIVLAEGEEIRTLKDVYKRQGFYLPVQRVCRPNHTFRGFQGQIESGSINVGDEITTLPSNESAHVKEIYVGDKKSNTAFKGQPVTITLDKEVDGSRGCVLVKGTNLAPYKRLTASLLWMDDEPLTVGKDYLVKIGTKTIAGIVAGIDYAIDVNTGEHINAETIGKNGIAVCEISVSYTHLILMTAEYLTAFMKKQISKE